MGASILGASTLHGSCPHFQEDSNTLKYALSKYSTNKWWVFEALLTTSPKAWSRAPVHLQACFGTVTLLGKLGKLLWTNRALCSRPQGQCLCTSKPGPACGFWNSRSSLSLSLSLRPAQPWAPQFLGFARSSRSALLLLLSSTCTPSVTRPALSHRRSSSARFYTISTDSALRAFFILSLFLWVQLMHSSVIFCFLPFAFMWTGVGFRFRRRCWEYVE
jgi:hypothetical protein